MKKHIPNILLLIVVLVNVFFISRYIHSNGMGLFFNVTGIIFLILGIFIFIFFLSIDPGYGWTKSIDLTKNYIMIFTSLSVSIAGIVLIVTGQHINELYVKSINDSKRCQQLLSGNAEKILIKSWYSLQDQNNKNSINIYLFQKKSNRNNYKIIATLNDTGTTQTIHDFTISSVAIPQPITIDTQYSECPGVIEKDINVNFDKHQNLGEQVQFSISITTSENSTDKPRAISQQMILFNLKSSPTNNNYEQQTSHSDGNTYSPTDGEFNLTSVL